VTPAGPVTKAPLNPLAPARSASPFPASSGAAGVGSLTYAADQVAKAIGAGVPAPGLPQTVKVASGTDDSPSSLRVALLAMLLLAVGVGVVVGLLKLSDREQVTNVESEAHRLGLPSIVDSIAGDAAEPSVRIGDDARTALAELEKGGALLVFADPSKADSFVETAELAVEVHRRLRRCDGLQVALVIPAGRGASADASAAAVSQSLHSRGVTSDLLVLVDPLDDAGKPGLWRHTRFDVPEDVAAVFLENGLQSMRVSPPSAVASLTRSHVAPLVREALTRHPVVVPAPALPDVEPGNGEGDGLPERGPRGGVPPPK